MRGGVGKLGTGRRCQANWHTAKMRLGEGMLMMTLASADPRKRASADDGQQQAWEERTISRNSSILKTLRCNLIFFTLEIEVSSEHVGQML